MEKRSIASRLKHAWNIFFNRDPTLDYRDKTGSYYYRSDRVRFSRGNERSIVTAIYNRIAMDAASIDIRHVKLDENGRYLEDMDSHFNDCLTLEANIDQSARAFRHDCYMSLIDEGYMAIVPVDTTGNILQTDSYDILSFRTGKIVEWKSYSVKVKVYNERTGQKEDVWLPKSSVGIVENPFYAVMNEPSSTLQRLIRKLNLLDAIDEQSSSGKLDLIIQLPYVVKGDLKKKMAEDRKTDLENQLAGSKYGIAYIDGTENVTQLNRPVENNLLKQIEYLTNMLYSQLSMNQSILDGTADAKTMINYDNRTIEPLVAAVVDEMKRKFLTKTARTRGQSVMYFRDPFRLMPLDTMAEVADKLTRNEILSKNEVRQKIGFKPSKDPKADQLINSNISQPTEAQPAQADPSEQSKQEGENQNGEV